MTTLSVAASEALAGSSQVMHAHWAPPPPPPLAGMGMSSFSFESAYPEVTTSRRGHRAEVGNKRGALSPCYQQAFWRAKQIGIRRRNSACLSNRQGVNLWQLLQIK